MKGRDVVMSSSKMDWETPDIVLDAVRKMGPIELDPATTADNPTGAERFFTPEDDGLDRNWESLGLVFCNPPYGRGIGDWVYKAWRQSLFSVEFECIMLVPARTDTKWWHEACPASYCFWKGRLRFKGAESSAPFPSALLYWGVREDRFRDVCDDYGIVMKEDL